MTFFFWVEAESGAVKKRTQQKLEVGLKRNFINSDTHFLCIVSDPSREKAYGNGERGTIERWQPR